MVQNTEWEDPTCHRASLSEQQHSQQSYKTATPSADFNYKSPGHQSQSTQTSDSKSSASNIALCKWLPALCSEPKKVTPSPQQISFTIYDFWLIRVICWIFTERQVKYNLWVCIVWLILQLHICICKNIKANEVYRAAKYKFGKYLYYVGSCLPTSIQTHMRTDELWVLSLFYANDMSVSETAAVKGSSRRRSSSHMGGWSV
jgi:hypothetical protein